MSKIMSFDEQYKKLFKNGDLDDFKPNGGFDNIFVDGINFCSATETEPKQQTPVNKESADEKQISVSEFCTMMNDRAKASSEIKSVKGGIIKIDFNAGKNLITFSDGYRSYYVNTHIDIHTTIDEPMEREMHVKILSAVLRHCALCMMPFGIYNHGEFIGMINREGLKSYDPDYFMIGSCGTKVYCYMFQTNIYDVAEKITDYGIKNKTLYSIMATMISLLASVKTSVETELRFGTAPDELYKSLKSFVDELSGYGCNYDEVDDDDENESLLTIEDIHDSYRLPSDLVNMIMVKGGLADDDEEDDECSCGCHHINDDYEDDEDDDDCLDVEDIELDLRGRE